MGQKPPVIYILHGVDELEINQFVSGMLAKLGEALIADINTTRLDGRVVSLEEVETACCTLPFMTKRRVVILDHPLSRLTSPASREKFLNLLERVPESTALVLIERQFLTQEKEKRKGKLNWLEKWAQEAGNRFFIRSFPIPQGAAMIQRIQTLARAAGGEIHPEAAELLASLAGEDLLFIAQEIEKLVAYTNYHRPIELEDVERLTIDHGHGDIFSLVDAVGNRDTRKALNMLHRLLEEVDPLSIFAMIVRQFRFILLAREIIEEGGQAHDIARILKIHSFLAEKIAAQAKHFSIPSLTEIYHRLLEIDESIKSGEIEGSVALDTLIAGICR